MSISTLVLIFYVETFLIAVFWISTWKEVERYRTFTQSLSTEEKTDLLDYAKEERRRKV